MSPWAWVLLSVVALAGIGYVCVLAGTRSYARGYAAGQQAERRAVSQVVNGIREHGLAVQRDIDYLYERARRQLRDLG